MITQKHEQIFNAIKSDDLVIFAGVIKGNENISFGRFPILSLCFLYGSNKIIDKYFDVLCKIEKYHVIDEFFEIYNTFKIVAGRALRLYVDGSIVSPLEMLAILHKDNKVKKSFKLIFKNENIINNVKSIYSIHNQKVKVKTTSIEIKPTPLSVNEKKTLIKQICIVSMCLVVFIVGFFCAGLTLGIGVDGMPSNIVNAKQLVLALKSGGNYIITKDISLDSGVASKFSGVIDGNGKTIYIDYLTSNYLVSINNGTIKNVNIIYGALSCEIGNSLSLLVEENRGLIDNVSITCKELNLQCNKSVDNDIYVTGFATANSGTISNSRLKISAIIKAIGQGECVFAGGVGKNSGVIKDCLLVKDSNITTNDVDVTGFVATNEVGGHIYSCENYANISQTSNVIGWSPNVSGIALVNYGNIELSHNYGKLLVVSSIENENAQGNVFVGGIATMNYAIIKKCLNKGDLIVNSELLIVYSGGISAHSSYWIEGEKMNLPKLINCGNDCEINIATTGENAFVFAGGITGFLYGEMNDCYSITNFTNGYDEEKYFIGTALGSSYLQYQIFNNLLCIIASENYVLDRDNVVYQIGCLINNGSIVSTGIDCTAGEIITCMTKDSILEQEVYWCE